MTTDPILHSHTPRVRENSELHEPECAVHVHEEQTENLTLTRPVQW